jgi:hypothetical protein
MPKQRGGGRSVRGVGRLSVVLALLLCGEAARAQQEESPELRYLESGKANYSLGRYSLAIRDLRLARFMSLDSWSREAPAISGRLATEMAARRERGVVARRSLPRRGSPVPGVRGGLSRAGRAGPLSGPRPQAVLARPPSGDARSRRRARTDSEDRIGTPAGGDAARGNEHAVAAAAGNADTRSRAERQEQLFAGAVEPAERSAGLVRVHK